MQAFLEAATGADAGQQTGPPAGGPRRRVMSCQGPVPAAAGRSAATGEPAASAPGCGGVSEGPDRRRGRVRFHAFGAAGRIVRRRSRRHGRPAPGASGGHWVSRRFFRAGSPPSSVPPPSARPGYPASRGRTDRRAGDCTRRVERRGAPGSRDPEGSAGEERSPPGRGQPWDSLFDGRTLLNQVLEGSGRARLDRRCGPAWP